MSYHDHPAPDKSYPELSTTSLLEIQRRADELATRPNLTENQSALTRLAARMARRAQFGRGPVSPDLWVSLWALGEQLAAIDDAAPRPALTLTPPKPQRNFSESIWQGEKMPIPSNLEDE